EWRFHSRISPFRRMYRGPPGARTLSQAGLGGWTTRDASRSGRETPITIVLCPPGRRHYGTCFTSRQSPRRRASRVETRRRSALVRDGGVYGVADDVEPRAVPRVRDAAVGQVGERHARVRVRPAVGGAHPAVAERARRGDAAEAPDGLGRSTDVRPQGPMHGHAHVAVDPAPGDTARDVLDHAGRQEPAAVQGAAGSQRLVEGGHGAGGGVAAAARGAARRGGAGGGAAAGGAWAGPSGATTRPGAAAPGAQRREWGGEGEV